MGGGRVGYILFVVGVAVCGSAVGVLRLIDRVWTVDVGARGRGGGGREG